MTRLVTLLAAVSLLVLAAAVALVRQASRPPYRVAAVFDTANQMVAGQQVKVAGAVAGRVQEIDLDWSSGHPKARIVMSLERRFEPFRGNATCTILPEGLISESYVQCDPGSGGTALTSGRGGIPTVPLSHTTIPFSLQDVLNVFAMPTDQRLRVLISELGIGTSGRGQDLAGVLQRADPALTAAQRALAILDAQRERISTAVAQTDTVLSRISSRTAQVRVFVDRAATLASTAAARRTALSASVAGLPAMLDAARPALRSLDRAAASATPLLDQLRAAAPALQRLTTTLPAFASAGVPALHALAGTAARGMPVIAHALPVASRVRTATNQLAPLAGQLDALLVSLRSTGGIESTMQLLYTLAVVTSTYDNVSHLINFIAEAAPQCLAGEQQGRDVAGCSKAYTSPGAGTVPINDPGCGLQPPQNFWDDAYCSGALPGGVPTPAARTQISTRHSMPHTVRTHPSAAPPPRPGPVAASASLLRDVIGTAQQLTGSVTQPVAPPPVHLQGLLRYLLK